MKSEDRKKLLLTDTAVPDLFISEYLPGLTGTAVQVYLYLLMASGKGHDINEKSISSRLSLSESEVKEIILELTLAGLLDRTESGVLFISDIKASEVDRYIAHSAQTGIDKPGPISPMDQVRDELARSIEKTFFHGSMVYKWYREIDTLLFDDEFDPDVIYALFLSFSDNKRLLTITSVRSKAAEWKKKEIKTAKDLEAYMAFQEKVAVTVRKIGKRLRKKMTEYDEEYVRIWIEKMNYPYEVIDFAVKTICEYSNVPTLKRANEHIEAWYTAGIKTLHEAVAYEKKQSQIRMMEYNKSKSAGSAVKRKAAPQNFAGVTYSEEEMKAFEDDPEEMLKRYAPDKLGNKSG